MFLGAAEEQGAIVAVDQFSSTDGLQGTEADSLLRLVLVILIHLTCFTELMLLSHHAPLPGQFMGEEEAAQRGLWDRTIFLGSAQVVPVILMVFYSLS